MRAEAAYCQPIAAASLQGTTEVARENNEGLEWNVREELVPGLCPEQVATGLGLRQVEPQVERSAGGKGPDLDSRLETLLTVVVVVAQGKAKYFWLDIHVRYLHKPYLRYDAGSDRSRQTDANKVLAESHFA